MATQLYRITVESAEASPRLLLELSAEQLDGIHRLREALDRERDRSRNTEDIPSIGVEIMRTGAPA